MILRAGPCLTVIALCADPALAQDTCLPAPAPVLALSVESRYVAGDLTRSVIDREAEDAAKAALAPIDDFLRTLAKQSDEMLKAETDAARRVRADCLITRVHSWAAADALGDLSTQTARVGIGARLASFALLVRQAAPHSGRDAEVQQIAAWLSERIYTQMRFWEIAPHGASAGNLRAWAALAAAATAGLNDDPVMRGWAAWSVHYVLCSAEPDGAIPREMDRGARALHYQLHALSPLVTAIAVLRDQNLDLREMCDHAMDRAVAFALQDIERKGALSAARTGEPQTLFDGRDTLENFHVAWLEAFLSLSDDPVARAMAEKRRPLRYSKLGGDQTLIWTEPR